MAAPLESPTFSETGLDHAKDSWRANGYAISAEPLLPPEELPELRRRVHAVFCGEYDTGVSPYSNSAGHPEPHPAFTEVAMAQLSDRMVNAFIRKPAISRWVAAVTGAKWLQVWNVMLMKKMPTREAGAVVGWHQDNKYLNKIMKGQNINVWIALDEVTPEHGPVRYVRGSNRWNQAYDTSFFDHDADRQREEISVPPGEAWEEAVPWLKPGHAVIHERMTIHGSGLNLSETPRLNMIVHLRSEHSEPNPESYFTRNLDDPWKCPVVYDAR